MTAFKCGPKLPSKPHSAAVLIPAGMGHRVFDPATIPPAMTAADASQNSKHASICMRQPTKLIKELVRAAPLIISTTTARNI